MNSARIVIMGTALFFVAFIVLLPFFGGLGTHHHRVWIWTALAGWVLGLVGLAILVRHRREGRTL